MRGADASSSAANRRSRRRSPLRAGSQMVGKAVDRLRLRDADRAATPSRPWAT